MKQPLKRLSRNGAVRKALKKVTKAVTSVGKGVPMAEFYTKVASAAVHEAREQVPQMLASSKTDSPLSRKCGSMFPRC